MAVILKWFWSYFQCGGWVPPQHQAIVPCLQLRIQLNPGTVCPEIIIRLRSLRIQSYKTVSFPTSSAFAWLWTPIARPGCHLCCWQTGYRLGFWMTCSLDFNSDTSCKSRFLPGLLIDQPQIRGFYSSLLPSIWLICWCGSQNSEKRFAY